MSQQLPHDDENAIHIYEEIPRSSQAAAITTNSVLATTAAVDADDSVELISIEPSFPTMDTNTLPTTSTAASSTASASTLNLDTQQHNPSQKSAATTTSDIAVPVLECPICLQTCIHPARLPCGHIFCFLCVKGVAYKNQRCAMCRREIPPEFLDHPQLVNGIDDICTTKSTEDGYQWYYEGRNGWWQYDDRTSQDIEDAYQKGENSCTILVAGYVYVVDFETLVQQRQNEPARCRRVKRDLATIPKKGVAGLRIEENLLASGTNYTTHLTSTGSPSNDYEVVSAVDLIPTTVETDDITHSADVIIRSTLEHGDLFTRSREAVNNSNRSSGDPTWEQSSRTALVEELLDATQEAIATNQHTIHLYDQALSAFQELTLRGINVASEDEEEDENAEGEQQQSQPSQTDGQ